MRVGREQVDQQLHLVDQHRGQRLHALDGDALGQLVGELAQLGVLLAELAGAAAYVVGEQQLAARRRPQPLHRLEGALVGDGEAADLVDLVAEELHAQRVLLGRREDVDDAAAHGELAALLHQVDAGVRRAGQPRDHVLELDLLAGLQLDRLEVGQSLDLGLQHRPHRRHHDLQRAVGGVVAGVHEPAQHRQPTADGVAARAQPLVRERLPGGVQRDLVGAEEVGQLLGEVLGVTDGRRDRQHGATGADQALDDERPQRLRDPPGPAPPRRPRPARARRRARARAGRAR